MNGVAFISGEHLRELVEEEGVIKTKGEDEDENGLSPIKLDSSDGNTRSDWTVDLSLGEEVYLSSEEKIRTLKKDESISITPGEFALLMTEEVVDVPADKAALISMRFSKKLKGLVNVSGFHIDPNYTGRIIFSVYNAGPSPTLLRRGEKVFMIIFANLTQKVSNNRERANFNQLEQIKPKHTEGLQGRTASLEQLDDQVDTLQTRQKILITLIVTIFVGILVTIVDIALTDIYEMVGWLLWL